MSTREFCLRVSNAFASIDPNLKPHIDNFKKKRLDWEQLSFEAQYEGLVARPLEELGRRAMLTIDALDECRDRSELMETLRDKPVPLLKTLITGRPEADIKRWAMKNGFHTASFQELEDNDQDVAKYIRSRLEDQASDFQQRVIDRAEGLFIWARITCDLLIDTPDIDLQLKELEGPLGDAPNLDSIYRVALKQATKGVELSRKIIILVLQILLAMRTPLSIADLEGLLPLSERRVVRQTITLLGGLLLFQGPNDPIRLLHTTFREFLTSRKRAGIYFTQLQLGHYTLACGSLEILGRYSSSDINSFGEDSRR